MTKGLAILFALLLLGCRATPTLRVAVPRNFSGFLPCLADKKSGLGFHSSEISIDWVRDTASALEQLKSSKAELAVVGVPNLIPALKERPDFRIVTEVLNSTRSMVMVVRTSSKISTPRQLLGKKIGLVEGPPSEIFLEYFLLTEGINLGGVKKSVHSLDEMIKDFLASRIDAMVIWEPDLSRVKKENPTLSLHEFQSLVHESKSVLVGSKANLAKHQAQVDRLLASWIRAENWYAQNAAKAQSYLAECLKLDESSMENIQPALLGSRSELKMTNSLRQIFDRSREWAILRQGFKEQDLPTFSMVVDTSFLSRTRRRSITIGVGPDR